MANIKEYNLKKKRGLNSIYKSIFLHLFHVLLSCAPERQLASQ